MVVLDLSGFDPGIQECEAPGDTVLFFLEEVQRYGSSMVSVEETAAFVAEFLALSCQGAAFGFAGCVEVVELAGEHVP
ncbi:hypothetical protein [Propionibacterium freudenreichii]|uniref:hypothetical protein n=1 Tax=Propionibacterium freudenreichii TaxID=1744 RepID=UPI000BEF1761|nr:hypothetical protein [Propionibacterium freudenreichii]